MPEKIDEREDLVRRPALSDEALETSRLLVELLEAAHAVRRRLTGEAREAASAARPVSGPRSDLAPMSNHAVRAAIYVYQHGERTVGQIAAGLGISFGWASRVVDELEAARYVVRERDARDRRVVHVRLDTSAVEYVERAYRWHGEAVQAALDPLPPGGYDAVRLFLRRLIDTLNEGRPERS